MRFLLFLFLSASISTNTCNPKPLPSSIPECIQLKIKALQKADLENPPGLVYSFTYNGKVAYFFNAPCCDQFSSLYDADCTLICHPEGGITGKGDGNCDDFLSTSTDKKLIWQDTRTSN
ncbi:MAG: hypothetical protein COB85_04215 [Bacteroidetes bacterium]|nr:MAG: hypothetical protein COB85_04215 [Bacteroidota bacterium]